MSRATKSIIEQSVLRLESHGYRVRHGVFTPEMPAAERTSYGLVVLEQPIRHVHIGTLAAGREWIKPKTAVPGGRLEP